MKEIPEIAALLRREDRFLLTTHLHPDGDGLGSMLALGRALGNTGKTLAMVHREGVPSAYLCLPGARDVRTQLDGGFIPSYLIALDCGDRERMALPPGLPPDLPIVNIDHHLSNSYFGGINLVDPEASATGEIVHRLLLAGGYELDPQIAMAIYVAIATDTGFFRYANTTRQALSLAAYLVEEFQLDPGRIAEVVHEQKSLNAIKLLGLVLTTLRLVPGGKIAWMYLSREMLEQYPVEPEETEGYINFARSIIGVEVALFFKEVKEGEVRVSWRSGPNADVSRLAAHFGGGGHARAAGCTIHGNLQGAMRQVLGFLVDGKESADLNEWLFVSR